MPQFKIGVITDSFRLPLRDAIAKAADVGAEGIQMYAVKGDMAPENLSAADRADLKKYIADQGLEIGALCGDLGGHGFAKADENPSKVERSKKIMDLAVEMGTSVVTTHIGVVPEDASSDTYKTMQDACRELATYGDSVGARFAIETGPEPCNRLKTFLESLGAGGVAVNFDPANLVMVTRDDPVAGAHTVGPWIVHTHAKDGVCKQATDPARIYGYFADGGIGDLRLSDYFEEVPLGEGQVDFPGWIAALNEEGFTGYLTIEREVGDNPEADIRRAVEFLRGLRG